MSPSVRGSWRRLGAATAAVAVLAGCSGGDADPAPEVITVTQTVGVTSTVTVSATPGAAPSPYQRTPETTAPPPPSQQWAVRTPAGLSCMFDQQSVTCSGDYDSGATTLRWRVGAPDSETVQATVTVPEDGEELAYGTQRSAGPWTLQMAEAGITFTHNDSGASAMFSRAGVAVG